MMAAHYAAISSNESHSNYFRLLRAKQEQPLNFTSNLDLPYNSPISSVELKRMLSSCKHTAAGEDKITYYIIAKSHPQCRSYLLAIMNKIFNTGTFPSQWTTAITLSFLKPGKLKTCAENYRPISLTSCVGKLMEKIINFRLTVFLEGNDALPPYQFGFSKIQSTTDALTRFTSDIAGALSDQQHVLCVSFDMKKAYDTTWRYGILLRLHEIGYPSLSRASYLTGRSARKLVVLTRNTIEWSRGCPKVECLVARCSPSLLMVS